MLNNDRESNVEVKDVNTAFDYIKYSDKDNEKEAVEALYNYYNTQKYIQIMQAN